MFLARKITRSKWEKEGFHDGEIPADAVTADLRTRDNKLSFWQCGEGTADDVEEAALALAAASERVDKLELVWISEDDLQTDGQEWDATRGRTPVEDLNGLHIDLLRLDFVRLGKVAGRVANSLEKSRYCTLTKKHVRKLLASAVKEGRVEFGALGEGIQKEVRKLL